MLHSPGGAWLDKLERKFGRFAIPKFIQFVIFAMAAASFTQLFLQIDVTELLAFDRAAILRGEVWRVISFIFIPPSVGSLFLVLQLYFFWLLGTSLENEWGAFKFEVFYLCGMLGTAAAGMITGFATNSYVNMSMFLACAILFPNYEIRLFFVLPIKIKYLAYLDLAYCVLMLITGNWPSRFALLLSLVNLAIFFLNDGKALIVNARRRAQWKREINKNKR